MNTGLQSESFRNWARQRIVFSESRVLHYGDIQVDLYAYQVIRDGRPLHLSATEYRLLCFFLEHPCCVLSREELIAAAWKGDTKLCPRSVDTHIFRLRQALTANGEFDRITTVRSAGYMLE